MEPLIVSLLTDDILRLILKELNKHKRVRIKEIRDSLIHQTGENTDTSIIQDKLEFLTKENVVDVQASPYKEFNSYYLTEDGLQVMRAFNNAMILA